MRYVKLSFHKLNDLQKEIATALLETKGAYSFEDLPGIFSAYFSEEDHDDADLLPIYGMIGSTPAKEYIEHVNWNAIWESSFEPVLVPGAQGNGIYAVIRAPFHENDQACKHDIVITPRMSFGTGHHATTFLMAREMSLLNFSNKNVFDYGTGTGVLAIIASREGGIVTAVDNDENCIENAAENFMVNNCNITLRKEGTVVAVNEVDIMLANINRNVILDQLDNIYRALKPGGVALFSGMLAADENMVIPLFTRTGFKIFRSEYKDQWWMLHVTR